MLSLVPAYNQLVKLVAVVQTCAESPPLLGAHTLSQILGRFAHFHQHQPHAKKLPCSVRSVSDTQCWLRGEPRARVGWFTNEIMLKLKNSGRMLQYVHTDVVQQYATALYEAYIQTSPVWEWYCVYRVVTPVCSLVIPVKNHVVKKVCGTECKISTFGPHSVSFHILLRKKR